MKKNKIRLTESQLRNAITESVQKVLNESALPQYGVHKVTDTFHGGNEYHGSKSSNEIDEDIEVLANRVEKYYKQHGLSVRVSFKRNSREVQFPSVGVDNAFNSKQPINKRSLSDDENIITVEIFVKYLSLDDISNWSETSKRVLKMMGLYLGNNNGVRHFIHFTNKTISIDFHVRKNSTSKARSRVIGKNEVGYPMSRQVSEPHWTY